MSTNEINNQEQNAENESIASEIRELLAKGHSFKDIIRMGYAASTVRQEARKWAKQHGGAHEESKAPVSLTVKDKEQVLPEWLESQVSTIFDGSLQSQKAFIAGMAVPLLGMRMFTEAMRPIGDLMKLWQASQAELARENARVGADIAEQTVGQIMPQVLDAVKTAAQAQSPNPLQTMMVRMMEPLFTQLMSTLTGQSSGRQGSLPAGWKDLRAA
jgi:hypothetical protein